MIKFFYQIILDFIILTFILLITIQLNENSKSQIISLAFVVVITLLLIIRDLIIFKLIIDIDNFDIKKKILYRYNN